MSGLGTLISAELLKLRTTRMWWGLLLLGGAMVITLVGLIAGVTGTDLNQSGDPPLSMTNPAVLRFLYGSGFLVGYVLPLTLGVLAMAGEYRHQTITWAVLAAPRRGRLVTAKLTAYLLAGVGFGAVLTALGAITVAVVLTVRGHPIGLAAEGVPRTLLLSVLGCGVWAIFGVGLGTLIRNQVAALIVALGSQLFVESLLALALNAIPGGGTVARFLPSQASSALSDGAEVMGQAPFEVLPWWGGALVLAGYGVIFATLGAVLTLRRDIT